MIQEEKIFEAEKEILRAEEKILAEEKKIFGEVKRSAFIAGAILVLLTAAGAGTFVYWKLSSGQVYVDKAGISAPEISISPDSPGVLKSVAVNEGDEVSPNTVVAHVGDELIKTQVGGLVISVNENIGKIFNPGEAVVTMIDPNLLRVVGQLDEDKGLSDIRVGDRAMFTVDAFGGKQYWGVVDEISPTSRQSDIVFNISDKRQVQQFNIKILFNVGAYPELKNGMSARIWIYKN